MLFRSIDFIELSPTLKPSVSRSVKTPQRLIEFVNGSSVIGFVSGNQTMRGQRADMIVIDECAYVTNDDLSAVTAIMTEHKDTILIAASTPSGAREQFYKWDNDPTFRTFHYPSMCRPKWTPQMEYEQRKENPGAKFDHEFLAVHGNIAEGVFQQKHIDASLSSIMYEENSPRTDRIYSMGVDWNPVNGTEIVITEADRSDPANPNYRTVEVGEVFREGNTQLQSLQEIIKMNRKWEPVAIYVDRGAGYGQIEMLNQFGAESEPGTPDKRLETIIRPIDFGGKIELRHPVDGTVFKDYAKPAIVENAIRCLEAGQITLSQYDEVLLREIGRAHV